MTHGDETDRTRDRTAPARWHVYIVRAADGTLYTGIAIDVDRRLGEHAAGGARAARYLRGRGPLALVYRRAVGDRALTLRAERRIKRLPRERKEQIVRANPGTARLLRMIGVAIDP